MDIINIFNNYIDNITHICLIYNISEKQKKIIYKKVLGEYVYYVKNFKNERYIQSWLLRKTNRLCKKCSKKPVKEVSKELKQMVQIEDKYKLIMYMYYYMNYAQEEIAKLLNCKREVIDSAINFIEETSKLDKSIIQNCLNDSNMGSHEKEQLLNEIMTDIFSKKARRFYHYKKKIYKIVFFIMGVLLVFGTINRIRKLNGDKQNSFSEEQNKIINNMMEKDGQKIVIDDYTITLEKLLYDENERRGMLLFSVVRDKHNMYKEYVSEHKVMFGDNGRFELFFSCSDSAALVSKVNVEKHKDIIYIYYEFNIDTDGSFNNKIYLFDRNFDEEKRKEPEMALGEFNLIQTK